MRLIDADALNKKMSEREKELNDDKALWESSAVSVALDMFAPTIQAIPLDKVKQAREDIENIAWKSCSSKIVDGNRTKTELIDREDVLAILDRLIESEKK